MPLLSTKNNPSVIKSEASLFSRLENSAFGMSERIEDTLRRVQILMNNDNLTHIQNILTNLDEVTKRANILLDEENVKKISNIVKKADKISNAIDEKKIRLLFDRTLKTEQQIILFLDTFDATVKEFNTTLNRGDYNFKQMTAQSIVLLNDLLMQIKALGYEMKDVLQQLKRSPSDLLFRSQTKELGPGE